MSGSVENLVPKPDEVTYVTSVGDTTNQFDFEYRGPLASFLRCSLENRVKNSPLEFINNAYVQIPPTPQILKGLFRR